MLHKHQAQNAPHYRERKAGPAVKIQRLVAVFPGNGAEGHLLHPGTDIFKQGADHGADQKDDEAAGMLKPVHH